MLDGDVCTFHDIRRNNSPYIVKSPCFCDHAAEVLECADISVEHVFIPMRDLHAAAESRRFVTHQTVSSMSSAEAHSLSVLSEITRWWDVAHQCGKRSGNRAFGADLQTGVIALETTIPVTLLRYPQLVNDAPYLYEKLQPLVGDIDFFEFEAVFNKVANRDLVHSFSANDR